ACRTDVPCDHSAMDPTDEQAIRARIAAIPISATLGFDQISLGEGHCSLFVPRARIYDGIFDSFHGGILMTAADSAAAFAILTQVGAQAPIATTDMGIRFIARCTTGIRVDARVVKLGRTLVPVHVDIHDEQARHVAVADVCYM